MAGLRTVFLGIIATSLLCAVAFFARNLLLPLLLALFLAILFSAFVKGMRRLRIPEPLSAGLITVVFISACLGAGYYLSTPFQVWVERGATIPYQTREKIRELRASAEAAAETVKEITKTTGLRKPDQAASTKADNQSDEQMTITAAQVGVYLLGTVTSMTTTFISMNVLLFFFLAFGRTMLLNLLKGFRDPELARRTNGFIRDMGDNIAGYFQIVTLINIGLGFTAGLALFLLDMPNPIFWGVVVGVMNFLPFVGPAVSIIAIGVASLLTFDSWSQILLPPLAVFLLNAVEAQFVTPTLVGKRLRLNPLAVILSIMLGAWMWGLMGAILAVPLLATLQLALTHFEVLTPVAGALR